MNKYFKLRNGSFFIIMHNLFYPTNWRLQCSLRKTPGFDLKMRNWTRRRQLMNLPSSPRSGIQNHGGRYLYGLEREHIGNLEYYAKINTTRNKIETRVLCAMQFKTFCEIIQCCPTSKEYNGRGPADLRILYDAKILKGEKIMRNQLYFYLVPYDLENNLSSARTVKKKDFFFF